MIGHDAPLIDAARQLSGANINLVVVCNDDRTLAGVITKTDLVRQIGVCQGSACMAAASSVMTRDVTICHATSWLGDVW
jgi:CBS domain-containing protein